jgi:hypothetical protein
MNKNISHRMWLYLSAFEYFLFQTLRAEIVANINIAVQTIPITYPGGVQDGLLIRLYHSIPELVIRDPE